MILRPLFALALLMTIGTACGEARRASLSWRDCGDGFDCAELKVPLDHARPAGEQIAVSVIRLPAQGRRIGSLVVNPGGPGGSGVDYARAARSMFSERLLDRFDIVGFDPRGVGRSAPVDCLDDAQLDAFLAMDATPDTPAEQADLVRVSRSFATACHEKSGQILPYLSTVDVARDLDYLRQALGDPALTYLGKSYGSLLGARYADLFPHRVRALVLDGGFDPTLPRLTLNRQQAEGFETAFRAYAADCLSARDCPFAGRTVPGVLSDLAGLLRRADARPLATASTRPLTEALATLGTFAPLYDRAGWPVLTESLRQALAGDGSSLLRQADQSVGRATDGSYSNQTEANLAITCADAPYPQDISAYARHTPIFGASLVWNSLPCAFWPVPARPLRPLRAAGAPPIVVVGTTRDPATPYAWSRALAAQLHSGVLLTYQGDGHTAYFSGSSCVDDLVERYLISRVPPPNGARCSGEG